MHNKNKKLKFLFCFFMFLLVCVPVVANQTSIDLKELEKIPKIIGVSYKTYAISTEENITLIGAKEIDPFFDNFFWGKAGFGAISGKRAGYLEGGLIFGWQNKLSSNFFYNVQVFAGAGGGGSAPQGGGFIVNPSFTLGFLFSQNISLACNCGYIKFLNGDIESFMFGFNINLLTYDLIYNDAKN